MLLTPILKIRFKQTNSSVASNDRIIRNLINSAKNFRVDWELYEKIKHKIKLNADDEPIRLTYRNMNYKKRKDKKKLWKMHYKVNLCTG